MRRSIPRGARALLIATISIASWQGCAQIAGLEEPPPVDGSTSSGGGSTGSGGMAGSGGGTTTSTTSTGTAGGGGGGPCNDTDTYTAMTLRDAEPRPKAIAVDQQSIYWLNQGTLAPDLDDPARAVWKADKAGANGEILAYTGVRTPQALAVDTTDVYWVELQEIASCPADPDPKDRDRVMRIKKDGSADPMAPELFWQRCGRPRALALSPLYAYWTRTTDGYALRKPKMAGAEETLAGDLSSDLRGIAVDANDTAYWANFDEARIYRRAIADGAPIEVAASAPGPTWVAVDSDTVYWTTTNALWSVDKIAGGVPVQLASGLNSPGGLVESGANLYLTDSGNQRVLRVCKSGGAPLEISTGESIASGIAVHGTDVYWTNYADSGQIRKASLNP